MIMTRYPLTNLVIKVVGVGGGGTNAVNRMIEEGIRKRVRCCKSPMHRHLQSPMLTLAFTSQADITKGPCAGANPGGW